jgi:hypothetical protein
MILAQRRQRQEGFSRPSGPGWLQVHAAWLVMVGCALFWSAVIALAWFSF